MACYYPVSLDVGGVACLVVGGGAVAARKARGLVECGAAVTVVAPDVTADLRALTAVTIEQREYVRGEAAGYRLVITATGRPAVDAAVHADAASAGVWVNSADDPAHCSFILPSVHRDGTVSIAVSTGGASPAVARWLRARVADAAGAGVGDLAALVAESRRALRSAGRPTGDVDWTALLDGPLPALVRQGRLDEARALLSEATGV